MANLLSHYYFCNRLFSQQLSLVVQTTMDENIGYGLSRGISRASDYDEPLQPTEKLRAAKRSEKQDVSSSED